LEEALDLSSDRILNELNENILCMSNTTIIYYYYVEYKKNDNMFRPFLI